MSTTQPPHSLPVPGNEEVHGWRALVSESLPRIAFFERLLADTERQKAARFLKQADRDRYVVAHGILRQLLGLYLSIEPAEIAFETGEFGKPSLVLSAEQPPVSFNMAHSGDMIVFAVARGRRVGIDVEAIRTDRDLLELAESQFSLEEADVLRALESTERVLAFYRCWTLKEAYVKARGEGLGFPLKQFSVDFGNLESMSLLRASDDSHVRERWSVFGLSPTPGYAGALVVEGRPMRVVERGWGPASFESPPGIPPP